MSKENETPGPVPYERFQEVVRARNELAARLEELESGHSSSEAAQSQAQDQLKQAQGELQAERAQRARIETAVRKGLPLELAERLRGESAEEMDKDADTLLEVMHTLVAQRASTANAPTPGVPPPGTGPRAGRLDWSRLSAEEIRKRKAEIVASGR